MPSSSEGASGGFQATGRMSTGQATRYTTSNSGRNQTRRFKRANPCDVIGKRIVWSTGPKVHGAAVTLARVSTHENTNKGTVDERDENTGRHADEVVERAR